MSGATDTWSQPASGSSAESPLERVERVYAEARQRWQTETNSAVAAWELGRACFDRADLPQHEALRADLAREGMEACRLAIQLDTRSAPGHYYLAMNLGQLARARRLVALTLVGEMEKNFKRAAALDPLFDHAGPHRSLGLLYRDAPGWPASIGHRGRAREHLQRSVELSPDYPDNQLSLLEGYLGWNEKEKAQKQLKPAEQALATARAKLVGTAWTLSWRDWDQRWEKIKSRLAFKPLESPRGRQ